MSQPVADPPVAGEGTRTRTPRRRRRHLRGPIWLICILLFLGCIFVLVDKTATAVAQDKVATKLTGQRPFTGRPTVVIHKFPFLTQALRGKYRDIEVSGPGLPVPKLGVAQISARLRGVHIPLSAVGTGVGSVPIDHADVTVTVPASRLGFALGVPGLKLRQSGANVRLSAPMRVAGGSAVNVDAIARLGVQARLVTVTLISVRVNGARAPSAVVATAKKTLTSRVAVPNLGLNVTAATARVIGTQLVITGSVNNIILK